MVWFVLGFTVIQAVMAIYEGFTKLTFPYLGLLWAFVGIEVDPKGIRGEIVEIRRRLTGEARASATASNPITLSALLAVGTAT